MTNAVLDASAVIAALQGERGGDVALDAAPNAAISAINFAEVVSKLVQYGATEEDALTMARDFGAELAPADDRLAESAGLMHARTRADGISLGDAFCLALAERLGVPAMTADRRMAKVGAGVAVRLIR